MTEELTVDGYLTVQEFATKYGVSFKNHIYRYINSMDRSKIGNTTLVKDCAMNRRYLKPFQKQQDAEVMRLAKEGMTPTMIAGKTDLELYVVEYVLKYLIFV